MATLYERFRPKVWADVIGQPKALVSLDCLRRLNGTLAGNVFTLSGPPGIGKTSIARLIIEEVSDEFLSEEIDGTEMDIAKVREWVDRCRFMPPGGKSWGFIINEVHRLKSNVVTALQTAFEKGQVNRTSTWCLTTTIEGTQKLLDGMDGEAFFSRTKKLPMTSQGLCTVFAARAQAVAMELGLDGKPLESYKRLVKDCKNNMRAVWNAIEIGEMLD